MKISNGILSDYQGLRVAIIPTGRKRRPQINMHSKTITIHNTGCEGVKADNFKRSCHDPSQDKEVSYHFVIDETEVIQLLPISEVGWHCGNREGNYSSIGIEICERDGAEENAIRFIVALCKQLGMTETYLRTHKSWSGKECPRLILPHWNNFLENVRLGLKDTQNNTQVVDKIKILLNGVEKTVESVNIDGHNYIKMRDLADNKIEVIWDSVRKIPIMQVKNNV